MYINLTNLQKRDLLALKEPRPGKITVLIEHNRTSVSALCRFVLVRQTNQVFALTQAGSVLQSVRQERSAQIEQRHDGRMLQFSGSATLEVAEPERARALLRARYGTAEGTLVQLVITRVYRLNLA